MQKGSGTTEMKEKLRKEEREDSANNNSLYGGRCEGRAVEDQKILTGTANSLFTTESFLLEETAQQTR
eukprot:766674-Hanusia_phi.AAC.1